MHLKEKLQRMEDDCKFTLVTIACSKAWEDEHFEVKARVDVRAWTCARGRARVDVRAWTCARGRARVDVRAWTCARGRARVDVRAWTCARGRARVDVRAWTSARDPRASNDQACLVLTCFVFTFQCVQNFPSLLSISRLGI